MAAFLPQAFYNQDRSFTPLFRLLDDFDNYRQDNNNHNNNDNNKTSRHGSRANSLPHWQPKFDVRETTEAFELHGELPGVNKEDVNIDFTEPQTLQIRGKSERRYTAGTPPSRGEDIGALADSSVKARQPTVEEEEDEDWSNTSNAGPSAPATPTTTTAELEKPAVAHNKPADNAKYWLTERKIGEFSRSFNFPTRVDQDRVSASFHNGILSIIVPKAKKHESRRILIN